MMFGRGLETGFVIALLASAALGACGQDKDPRTRPEPKVIEAGGAGGQGDGSAGAPGPDLDAGGQPGVPSPPLMMGPPCNAWSQLCDRPYDEVCFPATHAAMASSSLLFDHPAQARSIRQQLDDSIRALMLEVHAYEGGLASCFGDCAEGNAPFQAALGEIAGYLADNPREVVTLLVDNRAPGSQLAQALQGADLAEYLYTGDGAWPTLGEMIATNSRLVVFLSDATDAGAGYRSWSELRSTPDGVEAEGDLGCELSEGAVGSPFSLLRHYLVVPRDPPVPSDPPAEPAEPLPGYPSPELATTVNSPESLARALELCALLANPQPNFLAVDFYDSGDLIAATQRANGLIE